MKNQIKGLGHGFTLVELLVVVAIIAILAALFLPTLSKAKSSALGTQCKVNQKQIGIAMVAFVADHWAYPPIQNETNCFNSLIPYTGCATTGALYHCPTFRSLLYFDCDSEVLPGDICSTRPRPVYATSAESVIGSYGWNINGVGNRLGVAEQKESLVKNPSNVIALGDSYLVSPTLQVSYGPHDLLTAPPIDFTLVPELGINNGSREENKPFYDFAEDFAGARHNGLLNALFADGHVEGIAWRKLLLDRSDDALRRWNMDDQPHRELLK